VAKQAWGETHVGSCAEANHTNERRLRAAFYHLSSGSGRCRDGGEATPSPAESAAVWPAKSAGFAAVTRAEIEECAYPSRDSVAVAARASARVRLTSAHLCSVCLRMLSGPSRARRTLSGSRMNSTSRRSRKHRSSPSDAAEPLSLSSRLIRLRISPRRPISMFPGQDLRRRPVSAAPAPRAAHLSPAPRRSGGRRAPQPPVRRVVTPHRARRLEVPAPRREPRIEGAIGPLGAKPRGLPGLPRKTSPAVATAEAYAARPLRPRMPPRSCHRRPAAQPLSAGGR